MKTHPIGMIALVSALVACHGSFGVTPRPTSRVTMTELAPGVWMHTSAMELPEFGLVPSNGLVIERDDGPVLVDTAWTDAQTINVVDWAAVFFEAEPTAVVVTHHHQDRLGGIKAMKERAIPVFATEQTVRLATRDGWPAPDRLLKTPSGRWPDPASDIEVFYPGPGHAPDNVVVWVPGARLVYGGCLIKSAAAQNLGNVADADLEGWLLAIEALQARYPEVARVVPGHGDPGGPELLEHTARLVREALAAKARGPR